MVKKTSPSVLGEHGTSGCTGRREHGLRKVRERRDSERANKFLVESD